MKGYRPWVQEYSNSGSGDLTYSPSYVTNSAVSGKSQKSCAAHLCQARGIPRSLHQPPGPYLCPKKHTVRLFKSSVSSKPGDEHVS